MKINIISKQNFKGYDAAPLKTLYTNPVLSKSITAELREVCKKEGIKLEPKCKSLFGNAQDKCFILRTKSGSKRTICPDNGLDYIESIPKKEVNQQSLVDGGNMYMGKDKNGESWMMIGEIEGSLRDLDEVSRTYEVAKENIILIPQKESFMSEYHLDLTLRPIGYPYVLINNPILAYNNTHKDTISEDNLPESMKESYSTYKEQIEVLKQAGFEPIPIGGIYEPENQASVKNDFLTTMLNLPPTQPINYMNAVVNKHKDGSISYITNSSKTNSKEKFDYDAMFKKDLETAIRKIKAQDRSSNLKLKNIYFISGQKTKDSNEIRDNISAGWGGVHCMTLEEPNFNLWA